MSEVEEKAIALYSKNMKFLEKFDNELYNQVLLFEESLNSNLIEERYVLEYNEYFDIYDKVNNSWFYNENSIEYSKKAVNKVNFNASKNSFQSFYGKEYTSGFVDNIDNISILDNPDYNNAPIIDYVNKNEPKEKELKTIYVFLTFGIGLGHHIPLLVNKMKPRLNIIIEPSLEIFRVSLFTTDYEEISKRTKLYLYVNLNKDQFYERFSSFIPKVYVYNHYMKFFLFSKSCEMYFEVIQNILISQHHILYSYNRELASLSKTYEYVKKESNFLRLNSNEPLSIFNDKPVLLLAAGPSLKKNIQLIKENKDKFIVVSIFSVVPYLKELDIIPDIIFQYDENVSLISSIFIEFWDEEIYKNTVFIFSSHITELVTNKIKKENLFLFNALYSAKDNMGSLTGPSIGEITYAVLLILGVKELYLVGLDMALDNDTGDSHFDGYIGNKVELDESSEKQNIENFSFRKNVLTVKGNFFKEVKTLPVFIISIKIMNRFTNMFSKGTKIFNLSDGAYFEGTIPTRSEDIKLDDFNDIDKELLTKELKESLSSISEDKFLEKDKKYNELKLEGAKKLKEFFELKLKKRKHSQISELLSDIEEINKILSNNPKSIDLNKIIQNYYKYNLPYIVYLLNIRKLDNPKKHMKVLKKRLLTQLSKIIDFYIDIVEGVLKK